MPYSRSPGHSSRSLPRWSSPRACTRAPADQRPVVALVMKSLANEFFQTMEEGRGRHQAEHATASIG